jgi:heme-degrading monooxygenase HmoA
MISRHWKGVAKPGQAAAYIHHLRNETFPTLATIPGFVRASILSRPVEAGTEFQIVTVWQSFDAIQAFAGASPELAVVPPAVQDLMASYESQAAHYEVAETFEPR